MFPWSDSCQTQRLRRRRRLSDEVDLLEEWQQEICSREELPEVEIISLLEEQIPRYKLRADTLTQFTGYENKDWFIPSPVLKPEEVEEAIGLTPEQIRQTLNYFLLCSDRVSQMTKTYNDIEAVTRLLEEKEKDIELTARIGKELLAQNQKLEANVTSLETELRTANDKLTQLTHELTRKSELIQILTSDVDDLSSESGSIPSGQINFEILQRRVSRLEEENASLRKEATQLAAATEDCELQEAKLVADLASQLALVRTDLSGASEDADRQREEARNIRQLAESLDEKLKDTEHKLLVATRDNEELMALLALARDTQCELATELAELKERYAEILSLLQEAQETIRRQRKKSQPQARSGLLFPSLHTSLPTHNPESLDSELRCSLLSELSLDSGLGASSSTNLSNYKKVFETVRCASRAGSDSSVGGSPGPGPRYTPSSQFPSLNTMPSTISSSHRPRISAFTTPLSSRLQRIHLDSTGASDSECSDDYSFMNKGNQFKCGTPGPSELEAALQRLTPGAVAARRAALNASFDHDIDCRTPDSIMSTGSSGAYSGGMPWKLPDKLQIVKPLEGSVTLHHWSELATPSLSGLLEERPGVKVRGGTELEELGLALYSLSDVEEDEELMHPGKSFQDTGHIYTFTNSTVMHPDDNTTVTHSIRGSQMCTASSSRMSSCVSSAVPTPAMRSRRNSTSTFSTTFGLAKMLNERGIKAVTPSTLPTPMFTPTATPANSPDRSPDHSRSPSPTPLPSSYSPLGLPGFLVSSGAELLRRTLIGMSPKSEQRHSGQRMKTETTRLSHHNPKASLPGIKLVETLERIGLEKIMSTTAAPVSLQNSVVTTQKNIFGMPPEPHVKELGVPGRPGTGILETRLTQLRSARQKQGRMRSDLGTVPGAKDNQSTPLGTLSSMLFGRKGGLL